MDGHASLTGLFPENAVVAQKVGAVGVAELVARDAGEGVGLADVGEIVGDEGVVESGGCITCGACGGCTGPAAGDGRCGGMRSGVGFWRDVARLGGDFLSEADGARPDGGKLGGAKRRHAARGGLIERGLRLPRHAVALHEPPRDAAQRAVALAFGNRNRARGTRLVRGSGRGHRRTLGTRLRGDEFVDGHLPLLPEDGSGRAAEQEPRGIERIGVEEREDFVDGPLQRLVRRPVLQAANREEHMILRPGRAAVLRLHMVARRHSRKRDARKRCREPLGRHPRRRVVRIVIVAVHDDDIGPEEILPAAVMVAVRRPDMVEAHGIAQLFGRLDDALFRVPAVPRPARAGREVKGEFQVLADVGLHVDKPPNGLEKRWICMAPSEREPFFLFTPSDTTGTHTLPREARAPASTLASRP